MMEQSRHIALVVDSTVAALHSLPPKIFDFFLLVYSHVGTCLRLLM